MIRRFENWLAALRRRQRQRPIENALGTRHVMIAICNRFESSQKIAPAEKLAIVENWKKGFSRLQDEFQDAEFISPKHTLFLPVEEAGSVWMPELGELCSTTGNEIELMAPRTTPSAGRFREMIQKGKETLAENGWLSRDKAGAIRYGYLQEAADSPALPLIPHEPLLRETGCYANFLPPITVLDRVPQEFENSLCYFQEADASNARRGLRRVRAERMQRTEEEEGILLLQAPLACDWSRTKFGMPHLEAGELSAAEPPSRERLRFWLDGRMIVEARPNWIFITLHTNGLRPRNSEMLLGEPMRDFYRVLQSVAARDHAICFHCVTTRELVNILHAAEAGHSGNPSQFRDFCYQAPAAFSEGSANCGTTLPPASSSNPAETPGAIHFS